TDKDGGMSAAAGQTITEKDTDILVTGSDAGARPFVRVFDAHTRQEKFSFLAYGSMFTGGVRVATGDVNGDGIPDIITAPGAGMAPRIKIFNGAIPDPYKPLASFLAYSRSFLGGVTVTAADVDGDGKADIITGPGAGMMPRVKIFSGTHLNGAPLASFLAYENTFAGGVRVAASEVKGDGKADLITAPGSGKQPRVRILDG